MTVVEVIKHWLDWTVMHTRASVRVVTRDKEGVVVTERVVPVARVHNGRLEIDAADIQGAEEVRV